MNTFFFFFGDPNKKLRVGADSGDTVGRPKTDLFFYLAQVKFAFVGYVYAIFNDKYW